MLLDLLRSMVFRAIKKQYRVLAEVPVILFKRTYQVGQKKLNNSVIIIYLEKRDISVTEIINSADHTNTRVHLMP